MPDVVDTDVDDYDVWLSFDHVFAEPLLEIGDFISADSSADDLKTELRMSRAKVFLEKCNIALRFHALLGDGVTEKKYSFSFAQQHSFPHAARHCGGDHQEHEQAPSGFHDQLRWKGV